MKILHYAHLTIRDIARLEFLILWYGLSTGFFWGIATLIACTAASIVWYLNILLFVEGVYLALVLSVPLGFMSLYLPFIAFIIVPFDIYKSIKSHVALLRSMYCPKSNEALNILMDGYSETMHKGPLDIAIFKILGFDKK